MGIPNDWKEELKRGYLAAFTSSGCYPLVYMSDTGTTLCAECCEKEIRGGWWAVRGHSERVTMRDVHWEGDPIVCDGCNEDIESAYGPVEQHDRSQEE